MNTAAIGLTGGIGSGKSLVASMFAELGVPTLDLDQIGKEITQQGQPALKQIIKTFGKSFLDSNGSLNRKTLAGFCFKNTKRTQQLNDILHPLIWDCEAQWLKKQQAPYAIIEASVLIESDATSRMHAIIVVLASIEIRKKRTLQREGYDKQHFESIIARQCDDHTRQQFANYLLTNNDSSDNLQTDVKKLHALLSQRYHRTSCNP